MRKSASYLLLVTLLIGGSLSWAKNDVAFSIEDAQSVPDAVDEITSTLESQGFDIVAIIDHAANAANIGQQLRPTTLVLARKPSGDVKLIRRSQTIGIDLPIKFLVWEDETGEIRLKFNDVGYLADRHNMKLRDRDLLVLDEVVQQFGDLDRGLITIDSLQSVAETVAALRDTLLGAGFFIPIVIDYRADSGGSGNSLRPTTLMIFGNPNVGTQLMQNQQEVGIDLPQKYLIWEDEDGQVHITWNDPFFIAKRAGIQGLNTLLNNIANALANFAASGAGP